MCCLWSLSVRMTDTGLRQVQLPVNVDSDGQKHIFGSRNNLSLKAAAKNCRHRVNVGVGTELKMSIFNGFYCGEPETSTKMSSLRAAAVLLIIFNSLLINFFFPF